MLGIKLSIHQNIREYEWRAFKTLCLCLQYIVFCQLRLYTYHISRRFSTEICPSGIWPKKICQHLRQACVVYVSWGKIQEIWSYIKVLHWCHRMDSVIVYRPYLTTRTSIGLYLDMIFCSCVILKQTDARCQLRRQFDWSMSPVIFRR